MNYYSDMINNLLNITLRMAYSDLDNKISSSISALSYMSQYKESLGLEKACVTALVEKKSIKQKEYIKFIKLLGMQKTYLSMFEKAASVEQIEKKEIILNSKSLKQVILLEEKILKRDFSEFSPEIWFETMTAYMNSVRTLEYNLLHEVKRLIDESIEYKISTFYLWAFYVTTLLLATFFIIYLLKKSTQDEIHRFTNAIMHLANGGRSLKLVFNKSREDDMSKMYGAYEIMRQVLLKGDVYTQLYQSQKEVELKNQQRENVKLEEMAFFDSLTQVFNRRKFEELSEFEIKHSLRYGNNLSFLMLDIDKFKSINDTYGHANGDEVLKHFSKICKGVLRDVDTFARLGGEEFVIMLSETDLSGAYTFAERLRKKVFETSVELGDLKIKYTVSIGIAILDVKSDSGVETVLKRADKALYNAKNSGRNTTIIYENASMT